MSACFRAAVLETRFFLLRLLWLMISLRGWWYCGAAVFRSSASILWRFLHLRKTAVPFTIIVKGVREENIDIAVIDGTRIRDIYSYLHTLHLVLGIWDESI
ncbi:hypothetical protein B0H10DRAFT_1964112 [Mycena sp. CBHHK59/15]|nr:hypothetical protein B0H10DRAFT_1964112 [Mycena sp. CBHHK59/15]